MAEPRNARTRTPIPQIVREDAHSGNMLIGFEMFPWTTTERVIEQCETREEGKVVISLLRLYF
jgi:hypothetical protein